MRNNIEEKNFNIAIAGSGPLLEQVLSVLNSESFRAALPHVALAARLSRPSNSPDTEPAGQMAQSNPQLPTFTSAKEMFKAVPNITVVLDLDEDSRYQEELRKYAPLNVNIITAQILRPMFSLIDQGLLPLDGTLRLLHMRTSFITMVNNLNEDVLLFDDKGITLAVNDYFLQRVNSNREDFIGRPCKDLEGEDYCCADKEHNCPLELAIKTGSKISKIYSRVNGSALQYFQVDVFPLPDDMGKPRFILTRDDVTEIFQLQRRLHQSEKMAAIGELSNYIAHEIRNPLFAIGGFANSLLRNPGLDEDGREKADIIYKEAQRLEELLKTLLNFSKPVEATMSRFDLKEAIEQTVKIMSMGDNKRKVKTHLQIQENLPYAKGNPDLLKQCLINIIKNAYEAMPDGGKLDISVQKNNFNLLEITVKDTGTGIKKELMSSLFKPFFSTKIKGAGLGLAMTKKLLEDMGGKLELNSKFGKGTTVRLLLLPALATGSASKNAGDH